MSHLLHQQHHQHHQHHQPQQPHGRGPPAFAAAALFAATLLALLTLLLATAGFHQLQRPALTSFSSQPPPPPPPQQQQQQQLRRRLPQCIVIGARKCGTRALLDFLRLHPRVRAAREEVHFFDRGDRRRLGLAWYRSRMPLSGPADVTLEKSPAYFVTESAPELVWRMNHSVKLVLILRDPVERVVSDYAQHLHRRRLLGKPAKPLEALVLRRDGSGEVNPRAKMVRTSLYHRHLRRWLERFGRAQLHLVDGDRLVERPHAELQPVEDFLGLPRHIGRRHFVFNATKGFYCAVEAPGGVQRCLGSEKGRKHPAVSADTLAKLRRFYAGHDRALEQLTGRRFEWMQRSSVEVSAD